MVSLHEGEWFQSHYAVIIGDLKLGTTTDPFSTFTVAIQDLETRGIVEKYTNCDLNGDSDNFIAKKIGNQFQTWDQTNKKYI